MLKVLRDNLKYLSWILWLVILVFVAFVFIDFGGGLAPGGSPATAAATVGGERISMKEFEREYRNLEARYREAFGGRLDSQMVEQLRLPAQALEQLVNRKLLAAEAKRRGLVATDEEVRRAILEIPGVRGEDGRFVGAEAYEQVLRSNGYTARDFEDMLRENLAIDKLTGSLTAGVAVADAEVERAWRERNEKAAVRFLLAPSSRHTAQATATPEEVRAHFDAHRADFRLPDQRIVDYLLVDTARLRAKTEVPAEEVARYYAQNPDEFTRQEEVRARHILAKVDEGQDEAAAGRKMADARRRLAAGEPFETVAAALSEDPGSKDRGGDLGFFGRGRMIREFEDAAFAGRPGEIVGPVRTTFGLHLIETLEHRPAGTQPLAEVETRIRGQLAGERAGGAAEARARELAAAAAGAANAADAEAAWKQLADDDVVTFVTTPAFGREETVPGIGRSAEFAAAAFALEPGAASAPVQVARGWAVLRLREAKPAREPELADVERRVRAAAERAKASRLAVAELERARAAVAGGRSLDEVAQELGLEVGDSGEFTREGTIPGLGAAQPIAAVAFGLEPGQLGGPVAVPAGAVLFEVASRTPFDAEAFAAARDATREELRRAEAERLLGALITAERVRAGVTYDPQLVEQFGLGASATG